MERLALPVAAFDLVYSSLALHYVADLEWLADGSAPVAGAGRSLVFSWSTRFSRLPRCRAGPSMPPGRKNLAALWLPGRRPRTTELA